MDIKLGDKITVSDHNSATWFDVIAVSGHMIQIQEKDLYRPQWIDKSIVVAAVIGYNFN